jgi:ribA/ribD-fused uncharacterized protein
MNSSRIYPLADSIVFHKTTAEYGGLSNMAGGYSLNINDVIISSVEHLYQACRFPSHPQLQLDIISEPSPMTAKWIGRKHIDLTRNDWSEVRFKIMQWVLEVKLSQNWETFGKLLLSTGDKPIVEKAPKDKIWGAVQEGDNLVGTNALGRLLMYVRERYVKTNNYQRCIEPLNIPDFMLLGHQIELVCNEHYQEEIRWSLSQEYTTS